MRRNAEQNTIFFDIDHKRLFCTTGKVNHDIPLLAQPT